LSHKRELTKLQKYDMVSIDSDGKVRLVGADIRTPEDDSDYVEVEFERAVETFLDLVILPRVIMAKDGNLTEPVWTDELVQWYQAIRNSARMARPGTILRIQIRRSFKR
jgi:hypothetical protein